MSSVPLATSLLSSSLSHLVAVAHVVCAPPSSCVLDLDPDTAIVRASGGVVSLRVTGASWHVARDGAIAAIRMLRAVGVPNETPVSWTCPVPIDEDGREDWEGGPNMRHRSIVEIGPSPLTVRGDDGTLVFADSSENLREVASDLAGARAYVAGREEDLRAILDGLGDRDRVVVCWQGHLFFVRKMSERYTVEQWS